MSAASASSAIVVVVEALRVEQAQRGVLDRPHGPVLLAFSKSHRPCSLADFSSRCRIAVLANHEEVCHCCRTTRFERSACLTRRRERTSCDASPSGATTASRVVIGIWIALIVGFGAPGRRRRRRLRRQLLAAGQRVPEGRTTCSRTSSPQQAGDSSQVVFKATDGTLDRRGPQAPRSRRWSPAALRAARRRRRLRSFAGPGSISQDGTIGFATPAVRRAGHRPRQGRRRARHRHRQGGRDRRAAGQPRRPGDQVRRAARAVGDRGASASSSRSSCSIIVLGSVAAMTMPLIVAFASIGVAMTVVLAASSVLRHRHLRAHAGGDDRPRRRDRLRAADHQPLPRRAPPRQRRPRVHAQRARHRRALGAVRRHDRRHRAAGHAAAGHLVPQRSRDRLRAGRVRHHGRLAHAAAGAAGHAARAAGQARQGHRQPRRQPRRLGQAGRASSSATRARSRSSPWSWSP